MYIQVCRDDQFIFLLKQQRQQTTIINAEFMNECVCPGDTLTYECTAMGGGSTVWTGTAFNCPANNNELILIHYRFLLIKGTSATCNNGAIVARSLSVEGNNNYTSQLNVTVTPDIAAKNIKCLYDNGSTEATLFSWVIPITGLLDS